MALLEDESVTLSTMQARLFELSGAEVLRELRLEAGIAGALADSGIEIDDEAVQTEEAMLLERFSEDEDEARMILDTLRRQEGLGPERYRALLWRNAALRRLVQDDIELNVAMLKRLHRLEHGPRQVIRLIVVPTLLEAEELHQKIAGGADFTQLASTRSIDPSRDRGGLLDPISLEDPSWPASLRESIDGLEPGTLSKVIFLEDRFALAWIQKSIPADDVDFETSRPELEAIARMSQERMKMAELAGRLGKQPRIRVLDPALRRAYMVDEAEAEDATSR